jgi:AcrR family transcriptional regulator
MITMDVELPGVQPQVQQVGRGDRVARTREAIVSSTLTLAMEGEVSPIVRDIAKLAGVSARTVFQHFADTAELYVAVLGRVLTSLRGDAQPGAAATGALDERISAVIGERAGRYEKLLPMWTFVETLQTRSSRGGASRSTLDFVHGDQPRAAAECFGQELTTLSGENR